MGTLGRRKMVDHSIRLQIANAKNGSWQITDPGTERQILYLTEPGIHIQGEAGRYLSATFQVLPRLDITVEAALQYVCPYCWMPLEQAPIKRSVHVTSEGEPAIFSGLTFTDTESGQALPFIVACEMSLVSSPEHEPRTTALLTCIEPPSRGTNRGKHVPDGICLGCNRPFREPHHKKCLCPPCRERKRQEYEAVEEEVS